MMDIVSLLSEMKLLYDYENSWERELWSACFQMLMCILLFRGYLWLMKNLYLLRTQTGPDWSPERKGKKASDSVLGLTLHFSRSQPQRVKFSYSLAYLINLNKEIAKNSGKPFRSKVNSIHFNKILLKICLHIFIYAFNKYFLNAYELSTVLGTVNKATGKIEPANQLNK